MHQTSLGCAFPFFVALSKGPGPAPLHLPPLRTRSNIARLSLLLRGTAPFLRAGASPAPSVAPPKDKRLAGITLIGVGGACDAAGVERFRLAGADAVVRFPFFPRGRQCQQEVLTPCLE